MAWVDIAVYLNSLMFSSSSKASTGWRWIFIIEGLLTVVVAVAFKFLVVDWPEQSTFLTPAEKALLIKRLAIDAGGARMDTLNGRSARRIFTDWKIYCGVLMYMGGQLNSRTEKLCCSV